MISIPFKYKTEGSANALLYRARLLRWIKDHDGRVVREDARRTITGMWLGKIRFVEFDDEEVALVYRLRFGQ